MLCCALVWLSECVQFDCMTTVMWTIDKWRRVCVFRLTAVSSSSPLRWGLVTTAEILIPAKALTHFLAFLFFFVPQNNLIIGLLRSLETFKHLSPNFVSHVLFPLFHIKPLNLSLILWLTLIHTHTYIHTLFLSVSSVADCLRGLLLGSLWYLGSDKSSSHCALPSASQAAL